MLVTVYYVDGLKNGEVLQPVQIRIPSTPEVIKATVEQVVKAPEELKLYSNVPAGTRVLGVNLDRNSGVATVDLSPEANLVEGAAGAEAMKAALVYSLTEIPGVKAVLLRVDGHPAMLHGIEWSKPVSRADLQAQHLFQVAPLIKFVQP
jgi:spore germination protein GerM